MKELDVLLERFLHSEYPVCDEADRRAFERLLDLSDPDLHACLALGGPPPSDLDLRHVIERIARSPA
jgi:succinate dehydrogenase flavin-adding protein (antitoxin of CptAB toxin-antitoxin module)